MSNDTIGGLAMRMPDSIRPTFYRGLLLSTMSPHEPRSTEHSLSTSASRGKAKQISRAAFILTLIVAGEMIFSVPFHTARFFRPTLLDAFGLSNARLGDIFAVYGVTAMLSYFPGGTLADRYSARTLMSVSLVATAAGGLYFATYPSDGALALLYGYWGVTTIFLFWGAMIRAAREWGGEQSQGKAFGILDGGRGLTASAIAVGAVAVLSWSMPENIDAITDEERRAAFRTVILLYSGLTFAAGALTWLVLPKGSIPSGERPSPFRGMAEVARQPVVWAQAAVIICAYCGYKGLDNYSLYAVQVLGMDEVEGARFAAYAFYTRPIAAFAAGALGDRIRASRAIFGSFVILVISYGILAVAVPTSGWLPLIYANIFVTLFAVFGLRALYFALIQETRTPAHLTGTTVGMVSFIGYAPEVFFASIAGRILDNAPGVDGHHHYFMFLAATAVIGIVAVTWLLRLNRKAREAPGPLAT